MEWWPLEEGYSFGGDRTVGIVLEAREDGRLYERFRDGDSFEVGRVLACSPPDRIVFTWKDPTWSGATEVEVSFRPEGAGTRVAVEHRGFERLGADGEGAFGATAGAGRGSSVPSWSARPGPSADVVAPSAAPVGVM